MVGRMFRALGSAAPGAGIRTCEGELRAPLVLLARKNGACLRFNSASESSPKPCKLSTCGFVNAPCLGTRPAGFKTQTCRFFPGSWARGSARVACEPAVDCLRKAIDGFLNVTNPSDNRI